MQLKFGKDHTFYSLLESQALVAFESAKEFLEMTRDMPRKSIYIDALRHLEHKGDELTHRVQTKVVSTFITPIDKEDIRELSQALDDVTDVIEAAAARAELYQLQYARPDLEPLVSLLVKATELIVEAMSELRKGVHKTGGLQGRLRDIHTVENESDVLFRKALATLFDNPEADALTVIKWKELYDRIEAAVDKCEDIAKIVEMILTKYG